MNMVFQLRILGLRGPALLIIIAGYAAYDAETIRNRFGPDATRPFSETLFAVLGSPLVLGNVWIPFVLLSSVPAIVRSQHPNALIRYRTLSHRTVSIGLTHGSVFAVWTLTATAVATSIVAGLTTLQTHTAGNGNVVSTFTTTPITFLTLALGLLGGTVLLRTVLVTVAAVTNRGRTAVFLAVAIWMYAAALSFQVIPVPPVLTPSHWFAIDGPPSTPSRLFTYLMSVAAAIFTCLLTVRLTDERHQRLARCNA